MTSATAAGQTLKHYDRQLSIVMMVLVFIRRWINYQDSQYLIHSTIITIVFFISYFAFSWSRKKWGQWIWIYLLLQIGLIETLGFLSPVEDTWGLLYFPLWSELRSTYTSRKAYLLIIALGVLMTVTLMYTFDWWIGLGYGLFMEAAGFLLLSPDIVYEQSEAARLESSRLLLELKKAHRELKKASRQAEELADIRERDRMANELHDSVSQLMFSIKLLAQSTRLMTEKEPAAVPTQLNQLQDLSNRALSQMRSLITQWRGEL